MSYSPLADDADWPLVRLPGDCVSEPGFYEELGELESVREFAGYAESVRAKAARLSFVRATPADTSGTRKRFSRPSRP